MLDEILSDAPSWLIGSTFFQFVVVFAKRTGQTLWVAPAMSPNGGDVIMIRLISGGNWLTATERCESKEQALERVSEFESWMQAHGALTAPV